MISDIKLIFNADGLTYLLLISLALMPLNWSLEAVKWRYILKTKENVSFIVALKAVLSGTTISAVSPNRTGDYFGRVFVLKKTSFWEGVFLTLIGSYAQTITTLLFGGIAFFSLFAPSLVSLNYITTSQLLIFQYAFFAALIVSMLLYFRISLISALIPKKWSKIRKYLVIFKNYTFKQLFFTLILSFLRYGVFSLQYYIILVAVGFSDLSLFTGLSIVSTIFLLNTIRPSIALLEIGIRGSVAIFVFSLYYGFDTQSDNAIFTASTIIWLINIILPALMGLLFIKDLRFFKSKEQNNVA
jgi:hypothetical protein